ncbi:calponin homology domain-containing protein DDB_G0272472-like isoform X21 [Scylla paramamosain]|uniref:calponin homology domain-containing protein DDB_G0272472-like isoform X21 n=1 Tax=Scylla paramamosain TaxID=85552 RepID=UPI00308316E1
MGVKKTPPIHAENQQLLTPGLSIENVKIKEKTWGPRRTPGMSSPKHDRDSDRESLTGWTLVDREGKEGKPEKTTRSRGKKEDDKDSGESSSSPVDVEKKDEENKEKNESGCGTEEEGEEELSEDLISMGKRVQEIKDDGDVESLGSSDVLVLDQEGKGVDEETDLSLASSPSLPEDLPAIKPDTQYRHTPDRDLNSRLNIVVALTLACVLGLGLGHFLGLVALSRDEAPKGWSSRSMWQENLNSAQIIEALNLENEELRSEISRLQQENVSPIKISGKDGKIARDMRERITQLLIDNEELRVAAAKQQFDSLPEGDTRAFNNALGTNYKLRLAVSKLIHLVPDLTSLKVSANDLQKENEELQNQVGKLRYQEQPLPQELNAVTREVEGLKKVIDEASKKKKAPPNFENAKIYLSYMSQVLQSLQDFKEGGFVEKLDVATDVFEGLVPGNMKPSASVHQKLNSVRTKFNQLRSSLASKWDKIKDLGRPQNLVRVSQDTLAKMNRVIVNVVNKMKDIGQVSIMKRGKASFESTTATLAQSLAALGDQFEKTWNNLEAEVDTDGEEVGDELLAEEGRAGAEEEEEDEGIVDDMEAEERKPQDMGKEPSEIKNLGPNKAKEGGKSGEAGNGEGGRGGSGGRGGGGRGGGGGGGGGDDKKDLDDKKSNKETVEKKEKPDGKRDRSRSRVSSKEEKKEEKKEKKAKKKEEKAKKKKEKEDKKSKKDKNNNKKTKEEKENYNHKKDDWGKKNLQEDDKRHQRKQFNKFDKKQHRHGSDDDDDDDDDDEENDDGKFKKKYQKKKPVYEDDDDNDSDDNSKRKSHKNEVLEEDDDDDDKKKGLLRHWEKPSRKNYRREYPGPKKAFIRRRGKNATRYHGDEDRDWMQKRATGREVRRREEQKADWLFERAKHRSHRRVEEQKADWLFDRASHRRDQRVGEAEEHSHRAVGDNEKLQSHTKHERRQAKRRYVRFDYDDDDYDDDDEIDNDDYQLYHHPHHHHQHHHHHQERGRAEQKHHSKKGKREWVIPNFSATGKTYYY